MIQGNGLYIASASLFSSSTFSILEPICNHAFTCFRDLLVSVRFDEPSGQWSGCFMPEHLGDTQLKMRNYVSGALNMIRVEVQNADVLIGDEKISGSANGNSGTNLILISDDDTGYMPYRVDNFSKEVSFLLLISPVLLLAKHDILQ